MDRGIRSLISVWSVLAVLLCVSVCINIVLTNRLRALKGTPPSTGQVLPPIEALGLDGSRQVISYANSGTPTVLYVFSPACPWCKRNVSNLRMLVGSIGKRYRVVALSLDDKGLQSDVAQLALSIPVYHSPAASAKRKYGFRVTPETWVIGSSGKVTKHWAGAWMDTNQRDIEQYFGITLPGVADVKSLIGGGATSTSKSARKD